MLNEPQINPHYHTHNLDDVIRNDETSIKTPPVGFGHGTNTFYGCCTVFRKCGFSGYGRFAFVGSA